MGYIITTGIILFCGMMIYASFLIPYAAFTMWQHSFDSGGSLIIHYALRSGLMTAFAVLILWGDIKVIKWVINYIRETSKK